MNIYQKKIFLAVLFVLILALAGFISAAYWKNNDPLRVGIITDIHQCDLPLGKTVLSLAGFLEKVQERNADFIVSLGDNASHRLGECSKDGDAVVREIGGVLRSVGKPTHFVLGDHDIASSVDSYKNWLSLTGKPETYYSFDVKNVHVIILDTVLGGDALSPSCEELEDCRQLKERVEALKAEDEPAMKVEKHQLRNSLEEREAIISQTRSSGQRDTGRISETQLEWLRKDIDSTKLSRVVIFSDHPVFHFISERKEYDIINGARVREVLEKSGKQVVSIAGEAHLWHEEKSNGVSYYIVDDFQQADNPWAFFSWIDTGYSFEKISH